MTLKVAISYVICYNISEVILMNLEKINDKTYVCNGMRFTKSVGKKYYRNTKMKTDLHRYIYFLHNGEIPKGFHIHHIDGNTENNFIENLEMISFSKHCKLHSDERIANMSKEALKEFQTKGIEKAKEWHKSKEGIEWHKQHYEKMKDKLYIEVELICQCCNKKYVTTKSDSKFCSNSCKAKNRRNSKIDNVVRICEKCGKNFSVNKYSKTRFCSKTCSKLK